MKCDIVQNVNGWQWQEVAYTFILAKCVSVLLCGAVLCYMWNILMKNTKRSQPKFSLLFFVYFILDANASVMALMNSYIAILSFYWVHLTKRFAITWPHLIVLIYFPLYMNVACNVMCGKSFHLFIMECDIDFKVNFEQRVIFSWLNRKLIWTDLQPCLDPYRRNIHCVISLVAIHGLFMVEKLEFH